MSVTLDYALDQYIRYDVSNLPSNILYPSETLYPSDELHPSVDVMALLGGSTAPTLTTGRLYWIQAPEGASLPYAVMTIVADTDSQEYFGTLDAGQAILQVDVVSKDKADKAIALAFRSVLRYITGNIGGLQVNAIYPINRHEMFNPVTHRFVFSADYEVHCEY